MLDLPTPLTTSLETVASAAPALRDPWWVFGGTAMALAGLEGLHVPDIDILTSPRDARILLETLGGEAVPDLGEGVFRSRVFGRILTTPVPLEIMADMDIRDGGDWVPVQFHTRLPVTVGEATVYIPTVEEQIAMARLFGRPKDLQRAEALERLIR
ncbi:hypothetical protein [Brevundimonas sp.]|uniref:hypothetical protein n=1 Tax=Brevundimonas sp. TaxID=1871086 RepID=UPI0035B118BC